MPYWYTTQCVRTQRSHAAELLLNYIRLDLVTARAVVDTVSSTVSRQSRIFDCRHAITAVSTEKSVF